MLAPQSSDWLSMSPLIWSEACRVGHC